MALKIFDKILAYVKCDVASLMDLNSIKNFLSQWIGHGLALLTFPWFFTGLKSFHEFVDFNYSLIFLFLLKNRLRDHEEFGNVAEISQKTTLIDLLPNCFSYLLPIKAGCLGIKYEAKAETMKGKMDSYISAVEQNSELLRNVSQVIGFLLENVADPAKFKEICGFELEVHASEEMIDCASFEKCLLHLRTNFSIPVCQSLITFFCSNKNFCHFIEKLVLIAKKKVHSTSRIVSLWKFFSITSHKVA